MNGKKTIPLLVIASMLLSLTPSIMFANAAVAVPVLSAGSGTKGTTIKVTGGIGTVPAGTTVQLYWDTTTGAWNGIKGLLNTTLAKSSGAYEVWFDVPEATHGTHYVWIKTEAGDTNSAPFIVLTKISFSANSGLVGDSITLTINGLGGSTDVQLFFINPVSQVWNSWTSTAATSVPETIGTGDGVKTDFSDTLSNKPIQPGSVVASAGATTFADNGEGTLTATPDIAEGTINYVNGDISFTFNDPLVTGTAITVTAYDFIETVATLKVLGTTSTNSVGSASATGKVPDWANGNYAFAVYDGDGNEAQKAFSIGPVITVTPTASTVGSVITITGRGFTEDDTITQGQVYLQYGSDTFTGKITTDVPVVVDSTGRIRLNFVIPQVDVISDEYLVTVETVLGAIASADFEVTALATVSTTPSFGSQASTFTVAGSNYPKISGKVVNVTVINKDTDLETAVGTVKTLADGTFSKAFRVPTVTDGEYSVVAATDDWEFRILDSVSFKIGTMNLILSDDSGPTGLTVVIGGNGFTEGGEWNATFGSKTIVSSDNANVDGIISAEFQVPQLPVETYTVTVWDVDAEISLTTTFQITQTTTVNLSVPSAPNGFNVTLRGYGFSDAYENDVVDFILYNTTSAGAIDWWDTLTVIDLPRGEAFNEPCVTNSTGEFYGYWIIPDSDIVSKGAYKMNVTDASGDYMLTLPLTIGDVHAVITPRKDTFKIGETITFTIEHSFGNDKLGLIYGSIVKIYDPNGTLVFSGDPLETWTKTGLWYTAPYSSQTAGGNPIVISEDAPLGTWSFKWIDNDGDTITSGTFAVVASTASALEAQVTTLGQQVTALTAQLSQLSTTVGNVATQATAASAAATAASTAATAASTAATAAATAAQASLAAATAAGTKADAATAAANNAAAAANGLTTLVYAAIGASLVAALAAIVALMQISRKIA
jgi:hypothetical protein